MTQVLLRRVRVQVVREVDGGPRVRVSFDILPEVGGGIFLLILLEEVHVLIQLLKMVESLQRLVFLSSFQSDIIDQKTIVIDKPIHVSKLI